MSFLDKINAVTLLELQGAPIVDLVERSTLDFAGLLRMERLPSSKDLFILNKILCIKVFKVLSRDSDIDALRFELDSFRRLVPHHRYDELNNCRNEVNGAICNWSSRWSELANLLTIAIESAVARLKANVLEIVACKQLLDLIKENPGSCESDLLPKLSIKKMYLKRYLAMLEASQLIKCSVRGLKKYFYPLD